jgi:adenylate cyclase
MPFSSTLPEIKGQTADCLEENQPHRGKAMTRVERFRLKNAMLISNFISNLIGVCVVMILIHRPTYPSTPESWNIAQTVNSIFMPLAFLVPFLGTLVYERPIRRYLTLYHRQVPPGDPLRSEAHRRLLNEPFFLIALDMGVWFASALVYALVFWVWEGDLNQVVSTFFINLYTGLITTTVAFFVFEFVLQRRVIPFFFPEGGLYSVPGTLRIRIPTRLGAMLLASNLVPFIALLGAVFSTSHLSRDPETLLHQMQTSMVVNAVIFMGVGVWVTFLVSSNITKPLQEIIRVLNAVRKGEFDGRVKVTSNDEIGYTGDVINEMNRGLRERDFIRETFGRYVTSEVRDEILAGRLPLDGEVKHVTVLFSDLRNFTPLAEAHPPKEVVRILNQYFKEMTEAIRNHHGLVLQYIGDEIMAVFGAPLYRSDHPVMAVEASLQMQQRLRLVNHALKERGLGPLAHGIGIHTGEVLAANIGSPERLSYALVGDTVNLASRLQELNKQFGTEIILSGTTRDHLGDRFPVSPLPSTRVKGKSQAVDIYSLSLPA